MPHYIFERELSLLLLPLSSHPSKLAFLHLQLVLFPGCARNRLCVFNIVLVGRLGATRGEEGLYLRELVYHCTILERLDRLDYSRYLQG